MKIRLLIAVLSILVWSQAARAQDIQKRMKAVMKKESFYEYEDREGDALYTHGWIEQIRPKPVFRTLIVEKKSRTITIEGMTTIAGQVEDTMSWGFCCFDVIVARLGKKGRLTNFRRFGRTNSKQLNDSTIKDGFFRIKIKAHVNDILILGNSGREGAGAIVYNIGELLKE